jgi:hypothetical protein
MAILTDLELQGLHQDLEDGLVMIVDKKHYYKMESENARLREAIDKANENFKLLGSGGHGETPLLLLNPELGDHAIILATFMPHSGADTILSYLRRECFDDLEQALKGPDEG